MKIETLFDTVTNTFTYIVWDQKTKDAVIIDSVLDFDINWMQISENSMSKVVERVKELDLRIHYVIDTHPHADHMSAANHLNKMLGAKSAIGEKFSQVRRDFAKIFGVAADSLNGNYDHYLTDNEMLKAGTLDFSVICSPGHTPACISLKINNLLFVGDALFQPTLGTGRCDFPSGSAHDLYHSLAHKIYALSDETTVYTGHDYPSADQKANPSFKLVDAKEKNKMLTAKMSEENFIAARETRDQQLSPPKLLYFAMWANINCGHPPQSANGLTHFPIPVKSNK